MATTSKPMSVRFSQGQHKLIAEEAAELGMTPSQYVRDAAFARALVSRAQRDPLEIRWMDQAKDQRTLKAMDQILNAFNAMLSHDSSGDS